MAANLNSVCRKTEAFALTDNSIIAGGNFQPIEKPARPTSIIPLALHFIFQTGNDSDSLTKIYLTVRKKTTHAYIFICICREREREREREFHHFSLWSSLWWCGIAYNNLSLLLIFSFSDMIPPAAILVDWGSSWNISFNFRVSFLTICRVTSPRHPSLITGQNTAHPARTA